MSQGTTEKRPDPTTVSNESARTWCEEARKILGRFGIAGDAKQLKQATQKIVKELDDLDELYRGGTMPTELVQKREEFIQAAFDLKQAENEYRMHELTETNARAQYYKRVGFNDKRKEAKFKPIEEDARKKKEEARNKLLLLKEKVVLIESALDTAVKSKKEQDEQAKSSITSKTEKKVISDGQSEEQKAQELIEHFRTNYDGEAAKKIADGYSDYETSTGPWYADTTDRAAKKNAIVLFNEEWNAKKDSYESGRKRFEKSIKNARNLLVMLEEMLSSDARADLLKTFYDGQDASLRRNWKLAGESINEDFVALASNRIQVVQQAYNDWQQLKSSKYESLKSSLEALDDPHFMLLGLEKLAAAVAKAEHDRDYKAALEQFRKAELYANEMIDVAETAKVKLSEYETILNEARTTFADLPVESQGVAVELPQRIEQAIDRFRADIHVRSLEELRELMVTCAGTIQPLFDELAGYKDGKKVAAKKKELAEQKDLAPFVEGLQAAVKLTNDAVFAYEGYGFDLESPVEQKKVAGWKQLVADVEKYLVGLARAENKKNVDNYQFHADAYDKHILELAEVRQAVVDSTTDAQNAIPQLKQQLQKNISDIERSLNETRDHGLRRPTWHVAAGEEVEFFKIAGNTDSISVLKDLIARSGKLAATADKTFDHYIRIESGMDSPDFRYNELKWWMERLVKSLSKKSLRQDVPTDRERLLEQLTDIQQEIRKGGPGLIDEKFDDYNSTLTSLESQINELIARQGRLNTLRGVLQERVGEVKNLIYVELLGQISTLTGGELHPDYLPTSDKLKEIEAGLLAETEEALAAQGKRLDNLKLEVEFLIDEGRSLIAKKQTDTGFSLENEASGEFQELGKAAAKAKQDERNRVGELLELRSKYDNKLKEYNEAFDRVKKIDNVDKDELKRARELYKAALKSAKKPQEDWAAALRQVDLALRLTLQLEKDPLASQTTERGLSHLKELNIRWNSSIATLVDSVVKLQGAIVESAKDDDSVEDKKALADRFNDIVVGHCRKQLNPADFQQELLVLGAQLPSDGDEKEKLIAKKRKIREQALVKVRRYMAVLGRDPIFTSLMFENNPWSSRGGAVSGLPLMRALNDLDLNVQRSV